MAHDDDLYNKISKETIRDFILNNPEIILQSLKRYEEKINIEQDNALRKIIENDLVKLVADGSNYIGGNPSGTITMFEFLDYRCGYCRKDIFLIKPFDFPCYFLA